MTTPPRLARRRLLLRIAACTLGCIPLVAAGCGGGPKLVPVAGTVTLDGQPLEGATLSFVPTATSGEATSGTDVSGPSGNFTMTFKGRKGLAPGAYRVLVSKTVEVAPPSGVQISEIFKHASVEKQLMGLTKETIPPQNFTHEVEVPEDGVTDLYLDFKSKSTTKGKT